MKNLLLLALLPAILTSSPALETPKSLKIAEGGRALADIVVDKNASAPVKKAAESLRSYLQKSTGAAFSITDSPQKETSIHVGMTPAVAKLDLDGSGLDHDGFILQGFGDDSFVILGGSDTGTEYGVYDFLERYVGVRWLMPTKIGEDIPSHPTLEIPTARIVENPVFLLRYLSPLQPEGQSPKDPYPRYAEWARHNRINAPATRMSFHHHMRKLFPPSKFAENHPEFYPFVDPSKIPTDFRNRKAGFIEAIEGKRYIPKNDSDHHWNPNFSAPGIVDAAAAEIIAFFRKHPEAPSYSLGTNDSSNFDQSPESLRRRSGKKNYLSREDISDDFFLWANAVVEKVLKVYPDKWFGMLAYNEMGNPPTKVPVHPRIVPFLTYERLYWLDPELKAHNQGVQARWEKVAGVLGWWDYMYGIMYMVPRIYPHHTQDVLQWGVDHTVQHKPDIHPEPLIHADTFVDRSRVIGYGTVLKEEGRLRMWYQAAPEDWVSGDIAAVAHAESDDGIHWHKRPLGIVKHGGEDNHLCDLALHSPSVFVDPEAPQTHRYRATGCGRDGFLSRSGLRRGYYTAHSADGLRWELDAPTPQWEGSDVITSIWHPGRQCGLVALKQMPWVSRMYRRCIHTAEFRDGNFGPHVSALYPDEYDDIAASQRGFCTGDYYGMSMMPAGLSTVGFIWNFWHDSLGYQDSWWLTGNKGSSTITLAWQDRPGGRWLHFPGRPDFISHRDLPWMSEGWVNSLSAPIEMGDEHWLYFGGRNYEHFSLKGLDDDQNKKWARWIKEHGVSGMGVARWPKHRLFGLEAPADATLDIELENLTGPFEVRINYETRHRGRIQASIANDTHHTADDFIELCGDALSAALTWKTGSVIFPPSEGKLRLTIHLEMAVIYAYEIIPAP